MKPYHLVLLLFVLYLSSSKAIFSNLAHSFIPSTEREYLNYIQLILGKHHQSTVLSQKLKQILTEHRPSVLNTPEQFILYIVQSQLLPQVSQTIDNNLLNVIQMNEQLLSQELKDIVDDISIKIVKNGDKKSIQQIKRVGKDGNKIINIIQVHKNKMKHFQSLVKPQSSARRVCIIQNSQIKNHQQIKPLEQLIAPIQSNFSSLFCLLSQSFQSLASFLMEVQRRILYFMLNLLLMLETDDMFMAQYSNLQVFHLLFDCYNSIYLTIIILLMSKQQIFKFIFNAVIHNVTLALKFPCFVSITWRRGQKIAEIKQRKQIDKGMVIFNQKLQLQCNMVLDGNTHKFQQKKTKFTVLIFSEKGNKQAGEVSFDVSEFLNLKQKEMKFQKSLQKCPDKNAKLSFTLTSYIKEQVQDDKRSIQPSDNPKNNRDIISVIPEGDFKKKKPDQLQSNPPKKQVKSQFQQRAISPKKPNIPQLNKINRQKIKLEEQNKKLKQQLNELRQLQIQNATLRRRYEEAQKKSLSYYSKKFQESKREYNQLKTKSKIVEELVQKKLQLQKQMCSCKQQMGRILNFAITSGNNQMTQEIYSIYQATKS